MRTWLLYVLLLHGADETQPWRSKQLFCNSWLSVSTRSCRRLDYQPLFGKGARQRDYSGKEFGKGVQGRGWSRKELVKGSIGERSSGKGLFGKGPRSSTSREGTYLTIDTREQRKSSLIMPSSRSAFHLEVSLASSNCHISIFG